MSGDERKARAPGADFPLPEELRRGLLEIAVGERLDRDGEARAVDLDSIRWPRLEPSAALMRRLAEIPASSRRGIGHARTGGLAGPKAAWTAPGRRGPGLAIAASYLLAAALTLAVGDPVELGRQASSELRDAAGTHVLAPAADAGSSMRARLSRGFGALRDRVGPAGPFGRPLTLSADRARAWFRDAVDSSSTAFRDLSGLLPLDAIGSGEAPQPTNPSIPGPRGRAVERERTFA